MYSNQKSNNIISAAALIFFRSMNHKKPVSNKM